MICGGGAGIGSECSPAGSTFGGGVGTNITDSTSGSTFPFFSPFNSSTE